MKTDMKTSTILKMAKPLLARSWAEVVTEPYKEQYICCAVGALAQNGKINRIHMDRVQVIIQLRILPHATLEGWLRAQGVYEVEPYGYRPIELRDRLQQHRHAWLDLMIAEFKAKGD